MAATQSVDVDFGPVDQMILAAVELYGDPATSGQGTAVSKRHPNEVVRCVLLTTMHLRWYLGAGDDLLRGYVGLL